MRLLVSLLTAALALYGQVPRLTEVQERRLANGARLLLVERRGLSAFNGTLVFQGGRAEEPAAATDLLARALFGTTWPEDLAPAKNSADLNALLQQEEGLLESIRIERLHLRRDPAALTQVPSLAASLESIQSRMKGLFSSSPSRLTSARPVASIVPAAGLAAGFGDSATSASPFLRRPTSSPGSVTVISQISPFVNVPGAPCASNRNSTV